MEQAEPRRPRWHVHVPGAWVNDPHGLTHHAGRYHVFFQQVESSTTWRPDVAWGHASSPDLRTWTAHPPVLQPGEGDDGCWSGGLTVTTQGRALIHYTSVREPDHALGVVREAQPVDATWERWVKGDVVVRPPDGHDLAVFRDPVVLPEGDGWRMLLGAGYADGRPAVLGFASDDLRSWAFDGVAAAGDVLAPQDHDWAGQAWECPQLLRVDGRDVLVVSVWAGGTTHHVAAAVGEWTSGRFAARRWTRLTSADGPYAASAFSDADARPCLVFWLRGVADPGGAWTGALSVAYRVDVVDDEVRLSPHPDVLGGGVPGEVAVLEGQALRRVRLLSSAGEAVGEVRVDERAVHVRVQDRAVAAPRATRPGPVHVLVDRVVLEVCTGAGLVGLPVPSGTVVVATDGAGRVSGAPPR